jgi:methionine sulfoxide reductase heme-binding subunit
LRVSDRAIRFALKPLVFAAALVPAGLLLWDVYTGNLSANPLSDITNETGVWTLRFLCITLAITPLRRLSGWNFVIRFRRMTGLFAFFYGTVHLMIYIGLDRYPGVDLSAGIVAAATLRNVAASIGQDIYKRPFITVGFSAWLSMLPLALTSTAGSIRRLGGKRWNALHRLVYLSASLGVLHYWWLVKADVRRPIIYGVVVALLLGFRVYWSRIRTSVPKRSMSPASG